MQGATVGELPAIKISLFLYLSKLFNTHLILSKIQEREVNRGATDR
jgi:hypothetical protein